MIWENCKGEQHITSIQGVLFRLVESQEEAATMQYVDTMEEQSVLESLLEKSKPSYPETASTKSKLDYLLKSPFRYPPLKWGSRFGRNFEPSLFYGGLDIQTTLQESAYYRFIFWWSMDAEPIKERLLSTHTLFSANYKTDKGIQLQHEPFQQYKKQLAHPRDYAYAQQLGTAMRESNVEAFEYFSARSEQGCCVALFNQCALLSKKPKTKEQWFCELSANSVAFKAKKSREIYRFNINDFCVDGKLPISA